MDKAKKKRIQRIIAALCGVALVAVLALMPVIAKQKPRENGPQSSVLSAKVQTGSIRTELIGGGALAGEDPQTVQVPAAVKLTGYLVNNGDTVKAGEPIASVDRVSVMKAITQVQQTLEYLTERIREEGAKDTQETVKALSGGTVKHLYAQKGDTVQSVMLEHGALAVLSLDGLMAVDLTVQSDLPAGQEVTVTLENGKSVTGEIKSNLAGQLVVTLTDKDYRDGQTVQVTSGETQLGSGQLYILSPWKATAYAGTVSAVSVKEGDTAKVGQTLMKLTDTGKTALYHQLVSQRQEYEELMLELFELYQTLQLAAPCDGVITGLDKDSVQLLSADPGSYGVTLLANAPNGDDQTEYINYVGRITGIGQNGWTLLCNPQTLTIADYTDLSGVPLDEKLMTQAQLFETGGQPEPGQQPISSTAVYERTENTWQQIDIREVAAGDILLFAFDSQAQPVWAVRVQKARQDTPSAPENGSSPGGSTAGSSRPSGGSTGGNWSGGQQQEESVFELYALETAQIAQVTPQSQVTLEISVDELDVVKLRLGMTAQIKVDALGGEKCEAQISDISNTGENNGGQSKFGVTLTMDRLSNMLSGMNATAVIVLESRENVLTIPVAALTEQENKTLVYTGYDEKKEAFTGAVEVTLGASDGENVQILTGLQEGQQVFYAYYDTPVISNAAQSGTTGFGGFGSGGRGGMSGFPGR